MARARNPCFYGVASTGYGGTNIRLHPWHPFSGGVAVTEREALAGKRAGSWRAFLFVLPFLRPHLGRLILVCLIDVAIVFANLTVPWLGKTIVDGAFPQRDAVLALRIAVGVAGLLALVAALTALRTFLYNATEQLIGLDLRRRMYAHLVKLSLDSVEALPVGEQQYRVTTDVDRIAHMLVRILPTLTMLVDFGLTLAAASYVDARLTLVVLLFLVPWTLLFVGVTHIGRVLDGRRLRFLELRDAGILQAAGSFGTIKALGRERREVRRNGKISVAAQRVSAQGYLILVGFEFVTQKLLPFLKETTVYLWLARRVVLGEITLGLTVPMIAYLKRLPVPLEKIVNFGCWIWQTMVSAERMMAILTTEPAVQDCPDAHRLSGLRGEVRFEGVGFAREGIGTVLEGVDLELRPGRKVAVVGPSGAGKSTLLGLALRFHDPFHGRVLVDGHDLRDLHRPSYLNRVGTVMQDTFVFGGTVRDNLRIVLPDASEAQMVEALEQAGLGEWLDSLHNPQSTIHNPLDHDLEGGLALSMGQRQRLGIARALLVDAPLLLLDEPTSALDAETESAVMATLRRVGAGRAVLLVTHRLGTVLDADEIVVLDRGRVVGRGTHDSLMAEGGLYAEMQRLYRATSVEKVAI